MKRLSTTASSMISTMPVVSMGAEHDLAAAFALCADAQTCKQCNNTLTAMNHTDDDAMHQAIRRTLNHRLGDARGVSAFAVAFIDLWRQMGERLEPVIGTRGFNVLFERSIQIASKAFPWLSHIEASEGIGVSLTGLKEGLEGQEVTVASDASYTVLVSFTDLLTGLIGASLTDRLLRAIWTPPAEGTELKIKS